MDVAYENACPSIGMVTAYCSQYFVWNVDWIEIVQSASDVNGDSENVLGQSDTVDFKSIVLFLLRKPNCMVLWSALVLFLRIFLISLSKSFPRSGRSVINRYELRTTGSMSADFKIILTWRSFQCFGKYFGNRHWIYDKNSAIINEEEILITPNDNFEVVQIFSDTKYYMPSNYLKIRKHRDQMNYRLKLSKSSTKTVSNCWWTSSILSMTVQWWDTRY